MPRIFLSLATSELLLMGGAAALGLLRIRPAPDRHILLAMCALLVACLIQVVVFTYLSVTGRMIGQALNLAQFDMTPLEAVRRRKRTIMRLIALLVGVMLFTAAAGAIRWRGESTSSYHLIGAMLIIVTQVWVFAREYPLLVAQAALVDRVSQAYQHRGRSADPPVSPANDP